MDKIIKIKGDASFRTFFRKKNIKNEYQINQIKINHLDLFRIKSIDETKNLGLFEDNSNSIQLVEWPQMIKEKPKNLIELFFEYENNHQTRSVQIKGINL